MDVIPEADPGRNAGKQKPEEKGKGKEDTERKDRIPTRPSASAPYFHTSHIHQQTPTQLSLHSSLSPEKKGEERSRRHRVSPGRIKENPEKIDVLIEEEGQNIQDEQKIKEERGRQHAREKEALEWDREKELRASPGEEMIREEGESKKKLTTFGSGENIFIPVSHEKVLKNMQMPDGKKVDTQKNSRTTEQGEEKEKEAKRRSILRIVY
jgi:hypothetical protein